MKDKIMYVEEWSVGEYTTKFKWATDKENFGEFDFIYKGDGEYIVNAEFMGIESIADVLSFWRKNKINHPEGQGKSVVRDMSHLIWSYRKTKKEK